MIVVRITGGLGNQMFQYAFARALQHRGQKVLLQWHGQRRQELHNGFELDAVFQQPLSNRIRLTNPSPFLNAAAWLLRKTARKRQPADIGYNPEFMAVGNGYLDGYWQTEKYFLPIEAAIREDFCFRALSGRQNLDLADQLENESCLSIHVRRGDYLTIPGLGEVCTPDYYRNAIARIDTLHPDTTPVVFSDDIPFCRELLAGRSAIFVDWNRGTDSWMDMALMSRCRHHIIANSSFSWWGAWLSPYREGTTCAPSRWFAASATASNSDIRPDRWLPVT